MTEVVNQLPFVEPEKTPEPGPGKVPESETLSLSEKAPKSLSLTEKAPEAGPGKVPESEALSLSEKAPKSLSLTEKAPEAGPGKVPESEALSLSEKAPKSLSLTEKAPEAGPGKVPESEALSLSEKAPKSLSLTEKVPESEMAVVQTVPANAESEFRKALTTMASGYLKGTEALSQTPIFNTYAAFNVLSEPYKMFFGIEFKQGLTLTFADNFPNDELVFVAGIFKVQPDTSETMTPCYFLCLDPPVFKKAFVEPGDQGPSVANWVMYDVTNFKFPSGDSNPSPAVVLTSCCVDENSFKKAIQSFVQHFGELKKKADPAYDFIFKLKTRGNSTKPIVLKNGEGADDENVDLEENDLDSESEGAESEPPAKKKKRDSRGKAAIVAEVARRRSLRNLDNGIGEGLLVPPPPSPPPSNLPPPSLPSKKTAAEKKRKVSNSGSKKENKPKRQKKEKLHLDFSSTEPLVARSGEAPSQTGQGQGATGGLLTVSTTVNNTSTQSQVQLESTSRNVSTSAAPTLAETQTNFMSNQRDQLDFQGQVLNQALSFAERYNNR
jgi:hypothetical protein